MSDIEQVCDLILDLLEGYGTEQVSVEEWVGVRSQAIDFLVGAGGCEKLIARGWGRYLPDGHKGLTCAQNLA
jgi:hypothetical protein